MMSPISGKFGANMAMTNPLSSPTGGLQTGGAAAAGGVGSPEGLAETLSQLTKILEQLIAQLSQMQAGGAAGGEGAGSAAPGVGGVGGGMPAGDSYGAGMGAAAPAGLPSLDGASQANAAQLLQGLDIQDPKLRQAMELIATHPDGAKLIAAAKAQGLTTIAANPALNPDGGAGTEGLQIPSQGRIEIANPNSADLIHVLAHELGHAATNGDGNSQLEEQTVDALGERIHQDLLGQASSFRLDLASYADLNQTNDVVNSLRNIGIRV